MPQSPPEAVHALDVQGCSTRAITLYGLRRDGVLLGVGALKQPGPYQQVELKSMHVAAEAAATGRQAILDHLLAEARARGATVVNLETGSNEAFRAGAVDVRGRRVHLLRAVRRLPRPPVQHLHGAAARA